MRRSGSGTDLGASGKSSSMVRLPDEKRPASPSACLGACMDLEIRGGTEIAAEGSGSRSGSRPSSSSRSGAGSSSPKGSLIRLPDDTGSNPLSRGSSAQSSQEKASLSMLKGTDAAASSGAPTNGSSAAGGLRDRMKMGLRIDVKSGAGKERPKTFRLLKDGETIEKYYDFGDQIHDGGSRGRVLKAFRHSDRKEVVIKVRAKKPDKASERAWREVMTQLHGMKAQTGSGEGKAHVLDITEILEDDKSFFVVMPKCEGGELFNFLVTEAEVPESECKRIIREILAAIGHLHENNLIHRDVKPENILFDDTDDMRSPKTVKLIDFDTCMEWTPVTPKSKQFVGTPGYIAPEALLGDACPQSDLWSVGVICYILMTGETPWTSIETLEDGTVGSAGANRMYNSLKSAVIDWESEPWPDFPLARDLCQKLMAFETEERPMSVAEALAHPWLSG